MDRHKKTARASKISLFIPDLRLGGAERTFLTISKLLSKRGHRVEIVLMRKEGGLLAELDPSITTVDLQALRAGEAAWVSGIRAILGLRRYLRATPPDVLLSTLTGANLAVIVAWLLAGRYPRLVIREASSVSNVRSVLRRILMRLLYPLADRVVVLTDYMKQQLQSMLRISGEKMRVIGNPLDEDRIDTLVGDLKDSGAISSWEPYLLSIGRLAEPKDFVTVIKAFALLKKDSDLNLVIIGDGPQRQMLEQLTTDLELSGRIYMPGQVVNPYPWLKQASVFVFSSKWEGYPNVLLEAQYLGRPIVSTEYDSSVVQVLAFSHEDQVRVVPVSSPEKMAASISDLMCLSEGGGSAAFDEISYRVLDAYEEALLGG